MDRLLYTLPLLACPLGMGAMMWLMMRGRPQQRTADPENQERELALMRAEIQALRDQERRRTALQRQADA